MIVDKFHRQWTQIGDEWVSGGLRIGALSGARLLEAMNALYPGTPPTESADDREQGAKSALASGAPNIDQAKLNQAFAIELAAIRANKLPNQLTAAELDAEQTRIARIYKAL